MFDVDNQAADFIGIHGNVAIIDFKFVPAIGDTLCASKRLIGCSAPIIHIGQEVQAEDPQFHAKWVNGIAIYYHPDLRIKLGYSKIRIGLKRLLFWEWLELEGAKVTPVFDD